MYAVADDMTVLVIRYDDDDDDDIQLISCIFRMISRECIALMSIAI